MLLEGLQLYVAEAPLYGMMKTLSILLPTDDVFALALGYVFRRPTPVWGSRHDDYRRLYVSNFR